MFVFCGICSFSHLFSAWREQQGHPQVHRACFDRVQPTTTVSACAFLGLFVLLVFALRSHNIALTTHNTHTATPSGRRTKSAASNPWISAQRVRPVSLHFCFYFCLSLTVRCSRCYYFVCISYVCFHSLQRPVLSAVHCPFLSALNKRYAAHLLMLCFMLCWVVCFLFRVLSPLRRNVSLAFMLCFRVQLKEKKRETYFPLRKFALKA